ncbi:hypothetical protein BFJ63_vAg14236 [Fusarium oxysporum f. sp. narcissi]|uniref:Uncharacterized protein n=3 Tax=Fusarium oxysporum TaxID=5507 RepID=A0A420PI94_FUSOX|nr:hypothetical protein BFJ65_g15824 [Fusarium oxysporum f. sp. cepae]RKK92246.1 hypothetical protein BFJ71_g10331 [Fusarium oxysporum]RYC82845.1 hypothetical protein BFJ63_vAg14236 [Fusarium oxysporum f. sp. narcissi]RKK19048.1 hypothetical protein BFJ67_g17622 [Fusarium oxysporum f. sp. cepae]RKK36802.1 hypothetical protein BFJ66_g13330 [Fusarium oxysporum f. sp. cepae]
MPLVGRDTFTGVEGVDYFKITIGGKSIKSETSLKSGLDIIFKGAGKSSEYYACHVDLERYEIFSWEKKDILTELVGLKNAGIDSGV